MPHARFRESALRAGQAAMVLLLGLLLVGCATRESDMHVAARNGMIPDLQRAQSRGGDVNGRSPANQSPLMLAAQMDHADATEWLLRHGADMNLTDNDGDTALGKLRELSTPLSGILGASGQRTLDVTESGGTITLTPTEAALTERIRQAVDQSIQIIERRVNELGLVEPTVQPLQPGQLAV